MTFNEEKRLWKKGYKLVAGLDEAGRGPLAGPVVASALAVLKFPLLKLPLKSIKDSKKLSAKKREELYKIITKDPNIKWGIGIVFEKVIDKINILEATKLAMLKAIVDLEKKGGKVEFLILDGNMKLKTKLPQKSIIKGDEKVASCALASILAKVSRDRIMERLHKKYPKYGFNIHKGYPTRLHFKKIKKYGPCKIHRKSFKPVSFFVY